MDKDTDGKLFAAALYVITDMWGKEMGDLQRASLANQIVREIERRGIVKPAAAAAPIGSADKMLKALRKIADLRYVEDANEPFDEALDIADAALASLQREALGETPVE